MRRLSDVSLKLEVLLYNCETWSSAAEDVRRLEFSDRGYLLSWNGLMSNVGIGSLVLRVSSEDPLSQPMKLSRLRCLGHVLRMLNTRLPHHGQFYVPPIGWKKPCVGQQMMRQREM